MANQTEIDDGLTEEERAALAEGDDEGTETHAKGEVDDGAQGRDDGENEDEDQAAADAAAAAEAEAAKLAETEAAAKAAEQTTTEETTAATTTTTAPAANTAITEAQAAVEAKQKEFDDAKKADEATKNTLAEKKAALDKDVDDGEITMAEFRKKLDDLNKQERDNERAIDKLERELERVQDKATGLADQERNRGKEEWDKQCVEFLDANQAYRADDAKMATLNSYVITIAKSEPALTGPEILAKAHRIVSGEPEPAAKTEKKTVPKVEAKKPELVPNLSKLPAAESTDTGSDGRWSALDRLRDKDYDTYEKKLGEMSQADQDAYLRAE